MAVSEGERTDWSTPTRAWVLVLVVASALWFVYLHFTSPGFLGWLTTEDSVTETISALLYLLAGALFLVSWVRSGFGRIFILGYALLFIFVGGEEISWGQRLIGVETPERLGQANLQNEINLHNLDGIHQHIRLVGLAVVFVIAIVMPLAQRFSPFFARLFRKLVIPVVPLWTLAVTLLAVAFMVAPRLLDIPTFRFDEVGELYLSVTFAIFALERGVRRVGVGRHGELEAA